MSLDHLYSKDIFHLIANLPHIGRLAQPQVSVTRKSKLCGSEITIDLCINEQGLVENFAQEVKACTLGQASAAIFGRSMIGAGEDDIEQACRDLDHMLKTGTLPNQSRFIGLEILAGVKDYPARHAATRLALMRL